ncbi:MAG: hypothetical protein A2V85_10235 [Chloroflexi bacterium RBG_16_72_14]|nr:MAG: hypothetical protein A2V85_10235 [Chloroflexi bacterium RBG_16_72_14]
MTSSSRRCFSIRSLRRSQKPSTASSSPTEATSAPTTITAVPSCRIPARSSPNAAPAITMPTRTSAIDHRDRGRHLTSGGTSKLTWTSPSSSALRVEMDAPTARSRSTLERSTGSGVDAGCEPSSTVISSRTTTAVRYRSKRSRAWSRSALSRSAWRAFSSIARRSVSAVSASVRRSRAADSASRSRSRRPSASSPAWRRAVTSVTASSATLSRPGFLAPRVWRSWSAWPSFFFALLVPRSAPLIEAWRRSRRAASSRWSPDSS